MHSVALFHFFQIWEEMGHFLQWTRKKSPCCYSLQRSNSSPTLSSSLYCMPTMWVFPHTEGAWPGFWQDPNTTLQSIGQIKEDSILTQARGWGGVAWGVGTGKRNRKKMVPFYSLWVSPKGEKLDLRMLYLLWVFVRFKWVNVSESIWKQRCIFIRVKFLRDKIRKLTDSLQPESFYKITFIKESLK